MCGVGSSGCCGRGFGSSGQRLPFVANLLLLVFEELLGAVPASLGCFGLIEGEGAGPSARTRVGGCGSTTVLGEVMWFYPTLGW